MISSELASHAALVSPHAVMPWPPRMTPMACGWVRRTSAMSRPSWKPGRRHGTHTTRSPKHSLVSASPSAAVARAMPASGWRWSTCGASTRACIAVSIDGAAPPAAMPAEVEGGDHLVLAVDAGVDVDQGAHPVEAQHGQALGGERAEVAAAALDPQQLDRRVGHRVDVLALRRRVAAGVVGVARVGPESVRALDELGDDLAVSAGVITLPSRRRCRPGARRRPARSSPTGGTPRPGRDRARDLLEARRAAGARRCCRRP